MQGAVIGHYFCEVGFDAVTRFDMTIYLEIRFFTGYGGELNVFYSVLIILMACSIC